MHQLTGVAQSADHCHADVARAGDSEYGLLPAVHTAYGGEGVRLRFLAGNEIVRAPQSRVHHAAGGAEDHRRAGAGAQRTVKGCFRQHRGIDLFAPQHPHDLAGGQHHVHVRVALLVLHGGQRTLRLLGGAGHDGHHKQLLGVHADLLGKVALGDGTEHLLGALGGGQVFRIRRELSLQEPHPAGTAAGEHGPVIFVPVGKALDELTALLHDGQVGGEVCVEYIVEAHGLQRRHHALRRGKLGVQMIKLRPGRPHRRCDLHHGDPVLVRQRVEHLAGVVVLLQTAHGTVGDALATEGAVALTQGPGVGHAHGGASTGAHQVPDAHALDLFAYLDAPHTLHAAVFDTHHRIGVVRGDVLQVVDIVVAQQVIVVGQLLELAVAAAGALGALRLMLAQQQPQIDSPGLADTG